MTGTTRGIGKTILPGLLEQQLKLVLVSRDMDRMKAIREELGASDVQMQLYECDLSIPAEVDDTANRIKQSGLKLDAILHNAAIDPRHRFDEEDDALWKDVWQVNLGSAVAITRHLLPLLRASDQGRVIFTGSVMSELGGAYLTAYAASKAGLAGLTRSLAHELSDTNITVNCIVPGAIQVEREQPRTGSAGQSRLIDWQSVRRRLTPSDLLGPVCLLLSQAGGGISAQTITIDGGLIHPLAAIESQQRHLGPMDLER
ncbi:MAG: SDR family oxidoreductase [Phycisphaeraceae bacterium]